MGFLQNIKDGFKSVPPSVWVGTVIAGAAVGAVGAIIVNKRNALPLGTVFCKLAEGFDTNPGNPYWPRDLQGAIELSDAFDKHDFEWMCPPIQLQTIAEVIC